MKVKARAKFIRMAPRKTRLLVALIRGLSVEEARGQLKFSLKDAAIPVLKTLNSAVANAQHNAKAKVEDLVVSEAFVDEGPTIHRFTPRAQGRATKIRKRMSHITIVVSDRKTEGAPEKTDAKKPVVKKAPAKKATKKQEANA